eukprot:gene11622-biopygen8451
MAIVGCVLTGIVGVPAWIEFVVGGVLAGIGANVGGTLPRTGSAQLSAPPGLPTQVLPPQVPHEALGDAAHGFPATPGNFSRHSRQLPALPATSWFPATP